MKQQAIEIKLLGQKIALKTSEVDPALTSQIVTLVQNRIKDAEQRAPKISAPHQIMLLALLDLAEEYILAKKRTTEFKQRVDEKSSHLLGLIDSESK